ncbi:MAG: hypothetical protein ACI4TJ_06880 [Candidatus Cryptobacteroides sp.]
MEKTEKDYAAFEHAMDVERIYLDNDLDFQGICTLLGLDSGPLEKLLETELGFSGEVIVRTYRNLVIKPL